MAPGRLGSDATTGASSGRVGMGSASSIVGTGIGTLGSSKGPITGRARTGSTPRGGGGGSGAGGASSGTILATGDIENPSPREGS